MIVPPWLILGLLCALALALMYQIASRRFGWRIAVYWALTLLGFLGAEMLAESLGWNMSRYGDLRLIPDLGGALFVIGFLWFLGV